MIGEKERVIHQRAKLPCKIFVVKEVLFLTQPEFRGAILQIQPTLNIFELSCQI